MKCLITTARASAAKVVYLTAHLAMLELFDNRLKMVSIPLVESYIFLSRHFKCFVTTIDGSIIEILLIF